MSAECAGRNILVVDDESDVRLYLSRLFQENGYSVDCAADGEQAMQIAAGRKPALITLDLSMPNKSGIRFYREIKSNPELNSIPVIFVTGVTGIGGASDTEHFYGTRRQIPPPDGFIAKPIDPDEMLNLVRKLAPQA